MKQIGMCIVCKTVALSLVWLMALGLSPFSASWAQQQQQQDLNLKAQVEYAHSDYRINYGDVLSVDVYHQDEFKQETTLVRDDGFATFKGVGQVPVAGKTLDEVTQDLTSRISDLIIEPIVTVGIVRHQPGYVYLAGAVQRPGRVQMTASGSGSKDGDLSPLPDMHLTSVLAQSGGLAMNADLSKIEVHPAFQPNKTMTINLWNLVSNGDASQDLVLQSGDSVFVPVLPAGRTSDQEYQLLLTSTVGPGRFPVRVAGMVDKPGLYQLEGSSPTLQSALVSAGGYKDGAHKNKVSIRRFNANGAETITVDPNKEDVMLRPNDIVYVSPQRIFSAGKYMENIARIFSPFSSISSAVIGYALLMRN